jgi:hypothetical protein
MISRTAIAALALLALATSASAISLGQVDDFQSGTTMGWGAGPVPVPPTWVANGGPNGAGDGYLRVTAFGSGPGGRLTTFNHAQWLGNYIAAGVTAIQISLQNQSSIDLSIRIGFKESVGFGFPGYVTEAMLLPANSGWMTFTISLLPGDLIAINNPQPYNTFFSSGIGEVRIIHAPEPDMNGQFVTGQLGIDNMRAVPEPGTLALLGGGFVGIAALLRHRRNR